MKKNFLQAGLLPLMLVVFGSCIGLRVDSPKPSDPIAQVNGFSFNNLEQVVIPITFSDPVNQSTVVIGKTLLLTFTKDANAAATLSWSTDSKVLTITTVKKRAELMVFDPDDGFCVTLIGTDTGDGAVKDQKGNLLDGDYTSRTTGGNYKMCFTIIG